MRIAFFLLAVSGLIFGGRFGTPVGRWFFYTAQSNLLIAVMFGFLIVRTAVDTRQNGLHGSACYAPRFQMFATLMVFFTLIIFWTLLAPFAKRWGYDGMWTYGNITTHFLTPMAAIVDYFLFVETGKLRKRDIALSLLFPAFTLSLAYIVGFFGLTFYFDNGVAQNFPYYFMDYRLLGWLSPLIMLVISSVYFCFAILIYRLDKRRFSKMPGKTKPAITKKTHN